MVAYTKILDPVYDDDFRSRRLSENDLVGFIRERNNVIQEYQIELTVIKS